MASDGEMGDPAELSYVLPYAPRSGDFNFNAMALIAVLFLGLCIVSAYAPLLAVAAAAGSVAYYYYPLKESTPRIGAGQYGVFIDGLGLISWRAIDSIEAVPFTSRLAQTYELQIRLNRPLDAALLADWRKLSIWRLLMKLPWHMKTGDLVRIPLEPFEPPASEIHEAFTRLWKRFG
ncbi:MAG: hypothetical protein ACFCUR_19630 [Rhodomicrobiaceae bacterium]